MKPIFFYYSLFIGVNDKSFLILFDDSLMFVVFVISIVISLLKYFILKTLRYATIQPLFVHILSVFFGISVSIAKGILKNLSAQSLIKTGVRSDELINIMLIILLFILLSLQRVLAPSRTLWQGCIQGISEVKFFI